MWVLGTDDTPVPYSPPLEDAFLPGPDKIVAAVRERLGLERPELTIGTRS